MIQILPIIFINAAPIQQQLPGDHQHQHHQQQQHGLSSVPTPITKSRVKKHSRSNEISHTVDWVNPCGGRYEQSIIPHKQSRETAFRMLLRSLRSEKMSLTGQTINIRDIREWFMHNQTYKFLAQVKPQSNINLTRWHRNIQIYVASLFYFKRKQRIIYQKKSTKLNGDLCNELEKLFSSARGILCQIENAINSTQFHHKINTIPRDEMKRRLRKFRTKSTMKNSPNSEIEELNEIDLKFLKVRYYEITTGMTKALNRWVRENKCRQKNLLNINNNHHHRIFHNTNLNSNNRNNSRNDDSAGNTSNNNISNNSNYSSDGDDDDTYDTDDYNNSNNNSNDSSSASYNSSFENNDKITRMCQRIRQRNLKQKRIKLSTKNFNKSNNFI